MSCIFNLFNFFLYMFNSFINMCECVHILIRKHLMFDYKENDIDSIKKSDFDSSGDKLTMFYKDIKQIIFKNEFNSDEYQLDMIILLYLHVENVTELKLLQELVSKVLSYITDKNHWELTQNLSLSLQLISKLTKTSRACEIVFFQLSDHEPFTPSNVFLFEPRTIKTIVSIFYNLSKYGFGYEDIQFFGKMTVFQLLENFLSSTNNFILSSKLVFFIDKSTEDTIHSFFEILISKFKTDTVSYEEITNIFSLFSKDLYIRQEFLYEVFPYLLNEIARNLHSEKTELFDAYFFVLNELLTELLESKSFIIAERIFLNVFEFNPSKLAQTENFKVILYSFIQWLSEQDEDEFIRNEELMLSDDDDDDQIEHIYGVHNLLNDVMEEKEPIKSFLISTFHAYLDVLIRLIPEDKKFVRFILEEIVSQLNRESRIIQEIKNRIDLWREVIDLNKRDKYLELLNMYFAEGEIEELFKIFEFHDENEDMEDE